jgi:hypothetical protein
MAYITIKKTNELGGRLSSMQTNATNGKRVTVRKNQNSSGVLPFFSDDFAGPTRNNANGFTWNSTGARVAPVVFDGYDCLRFRYGPDASGADSSAEQRYNLGRNCTQLWIEYQLHVPGNFTHRNDIDSDNNKFHMVWRDTYSDVTNGTWRVGFEYNPSSGNSVVRVMSSRWNYNSWTSANPLGDYAPSYPSVHGQTLISDAGALVKGQWNTVRIYLRTASNATASDGVQRMWINGALFVDLTDGKFWNYPTGTEPTDCYLRNGYFFGWSNSGFADETDFHVRAVKFYDTNPGWV